MGVRAMIGIIDYGAGNLHSVQKAIATLGFTSQIISRPDEFIGVGKIIFPGVGNAGKTMQILRQQKLEASIRERIAAGVPFLGICLGMQLLLEYSKETDADSTGSHSTTTSNTDCLSVFDGEVLPFTSEVKVPHMGWNEVQQIHPHPIFDEIPDRSDFYFVHSYYVQPRQLSNAIGLTRYGHDFCSVIARDHVVGVQFHPEKSGKNGLTLLHNFCSTFQ